MEQHKNIPQLRFPDFEGEWKTMKYGDIYSFRNTNSFSREDLNYANGTVKNIHYGDIHTKFATLFEITKELVPFINAEIELKRISDDNYCKEGDLVVADASEDYADVGKCIEIVNLNGEKVLAGLHTILARPDLFKMAIGFSGYLMKSQNIRLQIKIFAQGSKVYSISPKQISDIEITVPEIAEQTRIASFFTAIDKKITELKQRKSLLEQYKKGVMQKLFSQELRFQDDDGKEFPQWELKQLKEIAEIFDGTHQTPKYVDSGIPFYSVEQVTANDFNRTKFISKSVFEKENKRVKVEKGDILMTRIGDIGTSRLIDWDVNASFYVSLALIKISNNCNSAFLNYLISTRKFQGELWKRTIHVAFPKKINLGEIGNCIVTLPSLEEQTKIANFLSAIDEKINHTQTQIQRTEQFKKGLLQKMFC